MTFLDAIETPVLIGFLFCLALGVSLNAWFVRHLREMHPGAWKDLGSPSSFFAGKTSSLLRKSVYLWSSGYRQLNDCRLNRIGAALKLVTAAYFLLFLTLIVIRLPDR